MLQPTRLLAVAILLLLAATLLAPIYAVVGAGFQDEGRFSLTWFQDVLDDPLYREGLANSFWLALFTTLLCLAISIPLAIIADSLGFAGKPIWLALIQVPMILPPFVGAIGLKNMLSRNGGINTLLAQCGLIDPAHPIDWLAHPFWSCVVLEALYLYPITFLNVQAALANIDPALDEAARNLGAGAWRRFWRITLPLMRPGIFAGSTLVFIWAFTELGTPLMVDFSTVTAVQVFRELETTNPGGQAYALVVMLLVMSVLLYLLGKAVLGRPAGAMLAKATIAAQPKRLGPLGSLLATLPFAVVFVIAVVPHIGVILGSVSSTGMLEWSIDRMTLRHHAELLRDVSAFGAGHDLAATSIRNSLQYSLIATVVDLLVGFAIAYLAVRRRSWLTAALDSLAMLPLAVPGLVMAFGYFALTQGDSPVAFLNPLEHDPTPLLVIAYAVRRLPFIVRSCAAGLEQTSVTLEEAASNLGAGTLRTLLTVTVPLLMANFIAGGMLVFSRSMLEVSDSLILAFDKESYPLTKAIWHLSAIPATGMETASALGVWGMVLLIVTIAGASLALGKRLGALFRV
jgi:iron(III) transport system permease protein